MEVTHILSARFQVMEDLTRSLVYEESNQEPKHGRTLPQDPPDHTIALIVSASV